MTINSTTRKAGPFTGNDATTEFPFEFKVFSTADLYVVRLTVATGVEEVLTLTTDYTATLNADQNSHPGGTVTLNAPLATGKTLIVTSNVALVQPADIENQGGFYPEVISDALDRATIQIQQQKERMDRTISYPITDPVTGVELPSVAQRAGVVLTFDENGAPIAGPSVASVGTVSGNVANINTVAGISADVTTVAGISDDVTAVADNETNITSVAGNETNINAVNANKANIDIVSGDKTNIDIVAGDSANIGTLASISSNITTVAGISTDVTIVADNVTDVTNFSDVYLGPKASSPSLRNDGSALQTGDLYFNTTGEQMYVYTGSQWHVVYAEGDVIGPSSVTANTLAAFDGVTGKLLKESPFVNYGKNRLINGCMRVSQRYGGSATTAQGYTLDRWYCDRETGTSGLTKQQVYDAYSSHKMALRLKRTESDTNTQDFFIAQPIEQLNTRDLAGQSIVVSALVGASSALVTMGVTFKFNLLWQDTTTDQGVGGTWTVIAGDTKTPIDDFIKYSQVFTVPATATQLMISLLFTGFTGTAGASEDIYVTEVQLERGSVATEFEYRPYGLEFAMCQRYFQHVGAGWCGQEEAETSFAVVFPFREMMRATPTLSLISSSISARITSADRVITGCSIATSAGTVSGVWVLLSCSGGNVAGRQIFDRSGANIFYADAEL